MTALLAAAAREGGLFAFAALDELFEVNALDQPASLTVDLKAFEFAGPQVAPDRLNAQVQLGSYLVDGQVSLGGHRHDITKDSRYDAPCRYMLRRHAKTVVE